MRELHGIIDCRSYHLGHLKQHVLLFDKLHLLNRTAGYTYYPGDPMGAQEAGKKDAELTSLFDDVVSDLEFLESQEIVLRIDEIALKSVTRGFKADDMRPIDAKLTDWATRYPNAIAHRIQDYYQYDADLRFRQYLTGLRQDHGKDYAALCMNVLPNHLIIPPAEGDHYSSSVLQIGMNVLPAGAASDAWQDIFEFKTDSHDKLWSYRRFLHDLSTKRRTEAEVRDDIEWSLNEYSKAMKIHNLKTGNSRLELYVIAPLEILEGLTNFKLSTFAKWGLSFRKRKIELIEAEMKAPGRECAYVFEAQKRFGVAS